MRSQFSGVCAVMVLLLFAMPGVMAAGTTGIMAEPLGNTVKDVVIKEPIIALDNISVTPGKEFDYTIQVYDVKDLANMDLVITYRNNAKFFNALKCKTVEKGSLNSNSIFDYKINNDPYCVETGYSPENYPELCKNIYNSIRISFASAAPLKGSGSIAAIRCILNEEILTNYPFIIQLNHLNSDSSSGEEITWQIVNGSIAYGRSIKGDCDKDGYASTRDALMIIQMSVRKIPIDYGCDVNYDGRVDSGDARDILKIAQGKTVAIESGSNSGTGSKVRGSGTVFNSGEDLPIPLPAPQNLGIGGKGFDPIPIP